MSLTSHTKNRNFFKIWSADVAYVLGYLAADGNLSSCHSKSVRCESIDLTLMENIQLLVGYSNKEPKHYINSAHPESKPTYTIYWNSKEIYDDLINLGLTEKKSLTLRYPENMPVQYDADFIRGVFDGDGWICKMNDSSYQVGISSGSLDFISQVTSKIQNVIGDKISSITKQNSSNPHYQITINDKRSLSLLYQWLYFSSTKHTRLDRKYLMFSSIKKMDCYFIPPIKSLNWMDRGNYTCFCLSHLYLQYPHYREFFLNLRKKGKFITLDNGAAEHSLVSQEQLLNIVDELKPNEVISPDELFDKNTTLRNLDNFVYEMKSRKLLDHTKIFACPQGNTRLEWIECYTKMLNHPDVSVIGLSKIAVPKCWLNKTNDEGIKEARIQCIQYLIDNDLLKKQIHFLGMGDPTEFINYSHILLRSTDSCYTIYAAINGIEFGVGKFKRIPTVNSYFDQTISKKTEPIILHNFSFLRKQLQH